MERMPKIRRSEVEEPTTAIKKTKLSLTLRLVRESGVGQTESCLSRADC